MPNLFRKGKRKKSGFCRLNLPDSPQLFLQGRKNGSVATEASAPSHPDFSLPKKASARRSGLGESLHGAQGSQAEALRSIPDAGLGMLKADSYTPSGESGSPGLIKRMSFAQGGRMGDGSNCASSIGSGMPLNDIQTQMRATRSMRGCTR